MRAAASTAAPSAASAPAPPEPAGAKEQDASVPCDTGGGDAHSPFWHTNPGAQSFTAAHAVRQVPSTGLQEYAPQSVTTLSGHTAPYSAHSAGPKLRDSSTHRGGEHWVPLPALTHLGSSFGSGPEHVMKQSSPGQQSLRRSTPLGDTTHVPALPGTAHETHVPEHSVAQHTAGRFEALAGPSRTHTAPMLSHAALASGLLHASPTFASFPGSVHKGG